MAIAVLQLSRRKTLWLVCAVILLSLHVAHVYYSANFKETNQIHGHTSAKDSLLVDHAFAKGSPRVDNASAKDLPVDLPEKAPTFLAGKHDRWMDGLSSHKPISLINRRNISVPSIISVDDRFREEIFSYQQMAILPSDCAAPSTAPPPPVSSQDVYVNCTSPRVPKIMHMVWIYGCAHTFNFVHYLSGLSMLRFIRPCTILFWYDGHAPVGENWEHFTSRVTAQNICLEMLQITTPQRIWGKQIKFPRHRSDVVSFEALKHFGGMYIDSDVLVVRATDPLRCFDLTMGRETERALTNNFMFAVPHSPFIDMVIYNYKNYSQIYKYDHVFYPSTVALKFPELIHVEQDSINRPNWLPSELETIFVEGCKVDLESKYAVHLWNNALEKSHYVKSANISSIKSMHSTFGQVARLILYGDKGVC